jgi:ABC-2 type transport system ATP-binding protein
MADVVALCKRVIVIHHGKILFDGNLSALSDRFAAYKTIEVDLADGSRPLDVYGEVVEREGDRAKLRVPKAETARVAARLLSEQDIMDLTIEDPPIEDVIELVFAEGAFE